MGDGKFAGKEHKVRFELADREQLEYVGGLVARILGRSPKPLGRDGAFYTVDYDSVALSVFLDQDVRVLVEHLKDFIPDFLRGFFDAEGYVSCSLDAVTRRVNHMCVGVANTNLGYLHLVNDGLKSFGLHFGLRSTNKNGQLMTIRGKTFIRRHDVYHLYAESTAEVRRFRELIGFKNQTKRRKLDDLVAVADMVPRVRFDWFVLHYEKKGRKWVKKSE